MNILSSLPDALGLIVLTSWLPLKDLACLDSANLSHSSRKIFLSLLSGHILRHECVLSLNHAQSVHFIRWVLTRNVAVVVLTIPFELMAEHNLYHSFLDRCVPRLKHVRIEEPTDPLLNYGPSHFNKFLSLLVEHSRDLLTLTLCGNYQIPCSLFPVLSKNCPQLQTLDIQGKVAFSGWGVVDASTQLLSLASLSMEESNLIDSDLVPLLNLCPSLQTLHIGESNWITQSGVTLILNSQAPLKSIQIHGQQSYRNGADVQVLRRRLELTNLELNGAIIFDDLMRELSENCPALTRLSIENNNILTDAGILSLSRACKRLTDVNIRSCPLTSSDINNYFSSAVHVYFEPADVWLQFPDFTFVGNEWLELAIQAALTEVPPDDDL